LGKSRDFWHGSYICVWQLRAEAETNRGAGGLDQDQGEKGERKRGARHRRKSNSSFEGACCGEVPGFKGVTQAARHHLLRTARKNGPFSFLVFTDIISAGTHISNRDADKLYKLHLNETIETPTGCE
jgi:hypothetical protein